MNLRCTLYFGYFLVIPYTRQAYIFDWCPLMLPNFRPLAKLSNERLAKFKGFTVNVKAHFNLKRMQNQNLEFMKFVIYKKKI